MKKTLIIVLTLILSLSIVLSACDNTQETPDEPEDKTENYVRKIYLLPSESYNYLQQLSYEGLAISSLTFTYKEKNYSDSFTGENFSYENGIFTAIANAPQDMSESVIAVSDGNRTETVYLYILNPEKYGSTYASPDVGRLYGKKVMFFGDSITDQTADWWKTNTWVNVDIDGNWIKDSDGKRETITGITQNYVNMLNDVCSFSSCANTAIAGALISHYNAAYASKTISIPQMVNTHTADIENAQYIFIMGGTNDSYEINKNDSVLNLGEITDIASEEAVGSSVTNKPLSTFCGFYNCILQTIKKVNPNAIVICLSNIPCQSTYGYTGGVSNGHNNEGISEVNVAINKIAAANIVKYVDIYSALPPEDNGEYSLKWFTNDQLHPNETAYKLITTKILSESQSLLTKAD